MKKYIVTTALALVLGTAAFSPPAWAEHPNRIELYDQRRADSSKMKNIAPGSVVPQAHQQGLHLGGSKAGVAGGSCTAPKCDGCSSFDEYLKCEDKTDAVQRNQGGAGGMLPPFRGKK